MTERTGRKSDTLIMRHAHDRHLKMLEQLSPLLLFTFHKAVSTCLLQVFLTMHTSRRARSTPTCDRQRLRQRNDRSDI